MHGREGFEEFCRREYPRLVGTLTLYCGDLHLAEELAQEALARACDRWERVGSMEAPGAWVHRVAINAANTLWRRQRSARRARAHLEAMATQRVEERDLAGDVALREAVGRLPDRQRAAVVLRYFLDMSAAQAAVVLDTTAQAVRNLTHRAVARLEKDLDVSGEARMLEVDDVH